MSTPTLRSRCGGLLIVSLLFVCLPAHGLRCGSSLVNEGDLAHEVERRCGEPVHVDERVTHPYRVVSRSPFLVDVFDIPVVVEEWVYNFGPNRFQTLLRFANGRLIEIEYLQKGYRRD